MISDELETKIRLLLDAEKWPVGTVAAQLGLHHSVVERVRDQAGLPPPVQPPRPSMLDPFVPFIIQTFEKYPRLCASRLDQMVRERGYTGAPDHFRRMVVRRQLPMHPLSVEESATLVTADEKLARKLAGLGPTVRWLGDISDADLGPPVM